MEVRKASSASGLFGVRRDCSSACINKEMARPGLSTWYRAELGPEPKASRHLAISLNNEFPQRSVFGRMIFKSRAGGLWNSCETF